MQISAFSVNKYQSSIIFCRFSRKKGLGSVLLSRDCRIAAMIKVFVDVSLISETNITNSFPGGQFFIEGFHTSFRSHPIWFSESFYVAINLRKKKWLLNCFYNPHKNNVSNHLDVTIKSLGTYCGKYENVVFLGDFTNHLFHKWFIISTNIFFLVRGMFISNFRTNFIISS